MKASSLLRIVFLFTLPVIVAVAGCIPAYKHKAQHGDITSSPERLARLVEKSTPEGWTIYDEVKHFTAENLYEAINGRAEYYISFDVTGMAFARFEQTSNDSNAIQVSVFDMGTPLNAFGVFSGERSPGMPQLKLGRDSYRSGASYYIWKGKYYIRIVALNSTDAVKQASGVLAERLTHSLHDSGEPVWGLTALPERGRVPQSIRYFVVDAMGLDFMRNTYTAEYKKGRTEVAVFLSKRDSPKSAEEVLAQFKEYAGKYGEAIDSVNTGGVDLHVCGMGRDYDVVFQKGSLIAGVTRVKERSLAVEAAADLWRQLEAE